MPKSYAQELWIRTKLQREVHQCIKNSKHLSPLASHYAPTFPELVHIKLYTLPNPKEKYHREEFTIHGQTGPTE